MHAEPTRKGDLQSLTDGTLTEASARELLERMRWPNGIVCPLDKCGGSGAYRRRLRDRDQFVVLRWSLLRSHRASCS